MTTELPDNHFDSLVFELNRVCGLLNELLQLVNESEQKYRTMETVLRKVNLQREYFQEIDRLNAIISYLEGRLKALDNKPEPLRVSPWIIDEHCAFRTLEGANPDDISTRVAFIEKTPRVRIGPFKDRDSDYLNWEEGPKGPGGPDGDDPANKLYGHYPPSREWCDQRLKELGYDVP